MKQVQKQVRKELSVVKKNVTGEGTVAALLGGDTELIEEVAVWMGGMVVLLRTSMPLHSLVSAPIQI
jgi:hypothetical protein